MAFLAALIHENPLPPEFELGFVIGPLVMKMAAALTDAVFHQDLRAASTRAWVGAGLVFFWVWHLSSPGPVLVFEKFALTPRLIEASV